MSWARDLGALRDGDITFDAFYRQHRHRFVRWAQYFMTRWSQRSLDIDDLVQEGMIEAWRAVDRWDPGRGVALVRFVEYCVGSKMDRDLRQVVGWPSQNKPRVWFREFAAFDEDRLCADAITAAVRAENAEVIDRFEGLDRLVLAGVALRMPLRAIAAHVYADPVLRRRYRLDSADSSVSRVRRVIKSASRVIQQQQQETVQ